MTSSVGLPNHVRYSIIIGAVFVFWVFYDTLFSPVERHMWADPELLNFTGIYTIPLCYFVIVYFVVKHYGHSADRNQSDNEDNA